MKQFTIYYLEPVEGLTQQQCMHKIGVDIGNSIEDVCDIISRKYPDFESKFNKENLTYNGYKIFGYSI